MNRLLLFLFAVASPALAESLKISELPAASSVGDTDLVPIVQSGVNKRAGAGLIRALPMSKITDAGQIGKNLLALTTNGGVVFVRINADNSVTLLSASDFKASLSIAQSDVSGLVAALADKASITGSYSDPSWITGLAWSKISGTPTIITNFAGLTTAANKGLYFSAVDSPATFDLTAAGRALLDDATPADQRITMGLGDSATKSVGTTTGTVAAGDDSRITGAVQTSGTYSNPAWITALAWSKITGAPAFLTANQTITLTGAVTGSGTTSITTTLSADQARANLTGGSGTLNLSGFTVTLPTVPISQGGTGATTAAAAFAALKQAASTSATGVVQIATDPEVQAETDSLKAVVPSSLAAWWNAKWTSIKAAAQTIAGNWIFTGNLTAGDAAGDSLTVNAGTVTAPNATAVGSSNVANVSALDGRYIPRISGDQSTAALAFALSAYPQCRVGSSILAANNGTWSSWSAQTDNAWCQIRKQQNATSAAGWARASWYNFALRGGETGTTPAGRGFTFSAWVNYPADSSAIGLATDIYFGGQNTETGGALAARGLRVQIRGNGPTSNYLITAAIHDGTSETTATATTASLTTLIIRWLPSSTGTPGAGSRLEVWTRNDMGAPSLMCAAVLTGSIGSSVFAGSYLSFVASSTGTTPGYIANWEMGGISTYFH